MIPCPTCGNRTLSPSPSCRITACLLIIPKPPLMRTDAHILHCTPYNHTTPFSTRSSIKYAHQRASCASANLHRQTIDGLDIRTETAQRLQTFISAQEHEPHGPHLAARRRRTSRSVQPRPEHQRRLRLSTHAEQDQDRFLGASQSAHARARPWRCVETDEIIRGQMCQEVVHLRLSPSMWSRFTN